jgi:hypothetical protein
VHSVFTNMHKWLHVALCDDSTPERVFRYPEYGEDVSRLLENNCGILSEEHRLERFLDDLFCSEDTETSGGLVALGSAESTRTAASICGASACVKMSHL